MKLFRNIMEVDCKSFNKVVRIWYPFNISLYYNVISHLKRKNESQYFKIN